MTNNVVIALSCGTNDTNRATRAIHLATIAHKEGKAIGKSNCLLAVNFG